MSTRQRPGQVRDAICSFLNKHGADATVADITAGVRAALNNDLAPSSVRSYLRLNTPDLFERTIRGSYRLASTDPSTSQETDGAKNVPKGVVQESALGNARLIHTDCLDWLRSAEHRSVQGVVTDPPYGLLEYTDAEQEKLRSGRGGVWRIPPSFDGHRRSPLPRFTVLSPDDHTKLVEFFGTWARALSPVLVPGAHVLIASNPLLSHLVCHALTTSGFEKRGEIIRLVMTMRGGDRPKNAHEEFTDVSVMPRSMWEPWLLFRKPLDGRVQDNLRRWRVGGLRRPNKEAPFGDVIKSSPASKAERLLAPHPSIKPQQFLRTVVRAILPFGEGVILDPFAGSGSTLAAAEAIGYRSIGLERDERYFEMARLAVPRLARLYSAEVVPLFESACSSK